MVNINTVIALQKTVESFYYSPKYHVNEIVELFFGSLVYESDYLLLASTLKAGNLIIFLNRVEVYLYDGLSYMGLIILIGFIFFRNFPKMSLWISVCNCIFLLILLVLNCILTLVPYNKLYMRTLDIQALYVQFPENRDFFIRFYAGEDWFGFESDVIVDELSLSFSLLTGFLIFLCILYNIESNLKFLNLNIMLLFLIEFLLYNVFFSGDLLWFYIYFESILIPMFLMIGVWGSRERKIHAAYQFFLYTLFGSIFMLIGILFLYVQLGSCDMILLSTLFNKISLLPFLAGIILWFFFFIAFAAKIPMFPVHIWLPEAHVEAPTAGSVLLAGVLLKLGGFGMIRVSLSIFSEYNEFMAPVVMFFSLLGIIYCSFSTLRQIDLKKIIAYSSIVHMNFVVLGLFSFDFQAFVGSVFLMLSHGIVSGALFFCVGMLYDRYHTRNIYYYGGLTLLMPIYSFFLLFFLVANMGFPGTSSFVGEFLVSIGLVRQNLVLFLVSGIGLVFSAVYSIWLYNRVMFGSLRGNTLYGFSDLTRSEFFILGFLFVIVLLFGIGSVYYFNFIEDFCYNLFYIEKY